MRRALLTLPLLLALPRPLGAQPTGAQPRETWVLSAGAMEPGLAAALPPFRRRHPAPLRIEYATAPRLRQALQGGAAPDLLIAPIALIDELVAAGRLASLRASLGRVGVGVAAGKAAPAPEIADVAALRKAVEQAESLVFNRASTGVAMERLFERWGLTAAVNAKATRYATGAEVLEHLARTPAGRREFGFAAVTEIRMVPAVHFLGPLPVEVQNYTPYAGALLPNATTLAAELLEWLAGSEGRAAFAQAGIEPPPG